MRSAQATPPGSHGPIDPIPSPCWRSRRWNGCRSPQTGLQVQLCGDAHLANFGAFASPERQLLFDLNDFDETLPSLWEWT
jgi:hypothetical protein